MGLLDRVNQANQQRSAVPSPAGAAVAPPPVAPPSNGAPAPVAQPVPAGVAAPVAAAPPTAAPSAPSGGTLAERSGGNTGAVAVTPAFAAAKTAVHAKLLEQYANKIDVTDREFVKEKIVELSEEYIRTSGMTMTRPDRERLIESLMDDILGLGPLEILLNDKDISEIMINHPKQIYVEKKGQPMLSDVIFESDKQLMRVIDRVVSSIGRRVDESTPMADARLKDGSRVNVIIPPLALKGPCMTIRKFSKEKLGPADLVKFKSATPNMITFMRAAVRSRLNCLVSGGTGSGKTTLLNILSTFIPPEERIITCEDAAELQLQQDHVITLESRPANVEGKGAVPIRDLVKNCLRMRPDRIIVGECRGGEALDMLQAMNTGHDGSMATLHANNPHEALGRLETLVLMAGADLPSRAIREQMAAAVHIIVQQQRLRGGPRKVVSIAEILGIEQGDIKFQEIFVFKQIGLRDGKAVGYHTATGIKPMRLEFIKAGGEELSDDIFVPTPEPAFEELY
jgi:pilus assembly protein CpaF